MNADLTSRDPDDTSACEFRGFSLCQMRKHVGALECHSEVLGINPVNGLMEKHPAEIFTG